MNKYYLCCNLKNPNTNEERTCYLIHDSLEAILKYTSYCDNERMLMNTMNLNDLTAGTLIDINKVEKKGIFFIKKNKEDKGSFKVLYKNNEDLLYANYIDIYLLLEKEGLIVYGLNEDIYEKGKEIYKLIEEFIDKSKLKNEIRENFNEKFDSDKNPDYIEFNKFDLSKKIAFLNKNLLISLSYICDDPYRKIVFLSKLKRIVKKNLLDSKSLEEKKTKLKTKLRKYNKDYIHITSEINRNVELFLQRNEIKKESNINLDISIDDLIYRYQKLLEDENISDDEKEDIKMYIDEQKKIARKN